ncbi:MAG: hypothetical protein IIX89_04955 [Oscillospiraceae bacterium]|nr:hypothetical protein [Oscillospiraceae bacterium]
MGDFSSIVIALISFAGTAVGAYSGCKLTAYRISELEKKVEVHNGFARRIPVIEEQIKVANHRIEDLEKRV